MDDRRLGVRPRAVHVGGRTWVSPTARTWKRKDVSPADSDVSEAFSAMAAPRRPAVAVGWVGNGAASDAAVWRQEDDEWTRVEGTDAPGRRPRAVGVRRGGQRRGHPRRRRRERLGRGPAAAVVQQGRRDVRERRRRPGRHPRRHRRRSRSARSRRVRRRLRRRGLPHGRRRPRRRRVVLPRRHLVGAGRGARRSGGDGRQALLSVGNAGDVLVAGGYTSGARQAGVPVVWRSQDGARLGRGRPQPLPASRTPAPPCTAVRSISLDAEGLSPRRRRLAAPRLAVDRRRQELGAAAQPDEPPTCSRTAWRSRRPPT